MSSIIFRHVDFHYDDPYQQIFSDLELVMDTHWRTGLIGPNGQGKSTLLKLLCSDLVPNAGQIEFTGNARYFPARADMNALTREVISNAIAPFTAWQARMDQLLELGSEDSIVAFTELQERFQSLGGYSLAAGIEREFQSMGLDMTLLDQPFGTLSGGEKTRALLIGLFAVDGAFALIDEPTNHLDQAGRLAVAEYLAAKDGFLLVSHDREFLDQAVDHIVCLDTMGCETIKGNYSRWRQHRDDVELHQSRTRENLNREVKQLKRAAAERRSGAQSREAGKYKSGYGADAPAAIDRGFVGHKAAKQMKRALSAEKRIEKNLIDKAGLNQYSAKERKLKIETNQQHKKDLVTVNNVCHSFDGKLVLDNISLNVGVGHRLAITGANGSGKSTLLKILSGELNPDDGLVFLPGHGRFSFAHQEPYWSDGVLLEKLEQANIDVAHFRQILGSFGVKGNVLEQELESFSHGQLKKIDLVRSMVSEADVLIWDEPMNYIDVFSREQIESAILAFQPTMIFVEHDAMFVDQVATSVLHLEAGVSA